MIDAFEYPHMPYWFTIRQAAGIMKKSVADAQKCIYPLVILVFDEKYTLIGTLSINNLMKGLVRTGSTSTLAEAATAFERDIPPEIAASFKSGKIKEASERPISEIMEPVKILIGLDTALDKAAYLMECANLDLLPVLENSNKLAGVLRLKEVFQEISNRLYEK